MIISFRDWLDKESPPSANIWDYGTNAQMQYFGDIKSKYSTPIKTNVKSEFDPEEIYYCTKRKNKKNKRNKG